LFERVQDSVDRDVPMLGETHQHQSSASQFRSLEMYSK
jgi:hypothetical protein